MECRPKRIRRIQMSVKQSGIIIPTIQIIIAKDSGCSPFLFSAKFVMDSSRSPSKFAADFGCSSFATDSGCSSGITTKDQCNATHDVVGAQKIAKFPS